MKQPQKPRKPSTPQAPGEFYTHSAHIQLSEYENRTIQSLIDDLAGLDLTKVWIRESMYDRYDDAPTYLYIQYEQDIKNPKYQREMKRYLEKQEEYNNKLEEYNLAMKKYREDIKTFRVWSKENEIQNLKARLQELEA